MSTLVAIAVGLIAAMRGRSREQAPQVAASEDEREIEKHQRVHGSIDLRTTVLLVVIASLSTILFKDGKGLIPIGYIIAVVWTAVIGSISCAVSLWASPSLFTTRKSRSEERMVVEGISRRKVRGFHAATVTTVVILVIIAAGATHILLLS